MIHRTTLLVSLLLVVVGASALAYDRSEFLFLDEIEIGMVGTGKTVVAGDVIEEFAAEVLGIIDEPGILSDFIVVRVSGDVIGRSGGIAKGMSGSPVYVDGKLIGAVSRAASWSKELTPIGLVTPIEPMLGVLDAAGKAIVVRSPNELAVLEDIQLAHGHAAPTSDVLLAASDTIFAYPISTPLIVTGLSGRSLDLLMEGTSSQMAPQGLITDFVGTGLTPVPRGLSALDLTLLPMSGSGGDGVSIDPDSLEPGSAIGIALTTGDITAGALGTLTYRDGDAIIGFGHPFIQHGESGFPMTAVSVIDTMKSFEASFKLGTLGGTIGTILQDRMPAVGGQIGPMPQMIELSIVVEDLDAGRSATYAVGLIDEPQLIPELLLSTGFGAIDTTLDRVGPGTVEVTYQIVGDGMPYPLERRDVFLSSVDVAVYPPWQLASLVNFLQYNAFEDPQITRIAASMRITEDLNAVQINSLEIDDFVYFPGDTIHYRLELQTFQGTLRIEEGELTIPADLISEYVFVRAYGGPRTYEAGETAPVFEGLADVIDAVESLPSYDTVTVELFAVDPFSPIDGALYGITEVTYEIPGYMVYDEREIYAALLDPADAPASDPDASPDW